jgi:hypothetical protein
MEGCCEGSQGPPRTGAGDHQSRRMGWEGHVARMGKCDVSLYKKRGSAHQVMAL